MVGLCVFTSKFGHPHAGHEESTPSTGQPADQLDTVLTTQEDPNRRVRAGQLEQVSADGRLAGIQLRLARRPGRLRSPSGQIEGESFGGPKD